MKMVRYKQGKVPPLSKAEAAKIKELAARPDSTIDCSDIPELDAEFMERAVLWEDVARSGLYKPNKVTITAKVDADILEWLKSRGAGYQIRLNAILRDAMLHSS